MSFSAGVELIEVLRPIDEWMHQKVEDIVDDFLTPTTQQEKPNLTAFNASEMTKLVFTSDFAVKQHICYAADHS